MLLATIGHQTLHATRYPELAYVRVDRVTWRFADASTGANIGPYYRTRVELLADLDRYAAFFGCA